MMFAGRLAEKATAYKITPLDTITGAPLRRVCYDTAPGRTAHILKPGLGSQELLTNHHTTTNKEDKNTSPLILLALMA